MNLKVVHNASSYHYKVSARGVVDKGKSRSRKWLIVAVEEDYDTFPVPKPFFDALILLLSRLIETHELTWESIIFHESGKNLRMLLRNFVMRQ